VPILECLHCQSMNDALAGNGGFCCGACRGYTFIIDCANCDATVSLGTTPQGTGHRAFLCSNCQTINTVANRTLRDIAARARRHAASVKAQAQLARREAAEGEKQRKADHVAERSTEVAERNAELEGTLTGLKHLLQDALESPSGYTFESLERQPADLVFTPASPPVRKADPVPPPKPTGTEPALEDFLTPQLTGLRAVSPGYRKRRASEVELARASLAAALERQAHAQHRYSQGMSHHEETCRINAEEFGREQETYRIAVKAARRAFEAEVLADERSVTEYNAEIAEWRSDYEKGSSEAVVRFFTGACDSLDWPCEIPTPARVAFSPPSRQLVIEFELPTHVDAIPQVAQYRYVQRSDEITEKAISQRERASLYTSVVAQMVLRLAHEMFQADKSATVDSLVINAHVGTIDPRNGHWAHPCLVTLRTDREVFESISLANVDPIECLKSLRASISPRPADMIPVRPVLEFDMVDSRFVEEAQVLGALDHRPNLMELTPNEFESLVTNLFGRMGLETRQTQASRDGGVDCVAFDNRPIFGGKVVIQAKRYKDTVGVSAVRDLFGTMQNEGATKGILVATSGYGRASFEFANDKPLELIDGGGLLFLLKEHADIEARIEVPEDWVDPLLDSLGD